MVFFFKRKQFSLFLCIALSWDYFIAIIISIPTFRLQLCLGSLLQPQKKRKDFSLEGLNDRRQPFRTVGEGREGMK